MTLGFASLMRCFKIGSAIFFRRLEIDNNKRFIAGSFNSIVIDEFKLSLRFFFEAGLGEGKIYDRLIIITKADL